MVKLYDNGVYVLNGCEIIEDNAGVNEIIKSKTGKMITKEEAKKSTISYSILDSHNTGDELNLKIKFDSLTSHDITYVGIIQTARASGMKEFPIPYVLTNCHNSLCAVGGTINEDDHMFALSAAKKYGGIFVPTNLSVIHSYNREMMAKAGNMILGSDSHTRYGALGTMAVGEGGGELAKQLVRRTYDIKYPEVIGIYLDGSVQIGVGPQDVALAIISAVYKNNYVKNKVMEFFGEGVKNLPVEFRNGIDVMTTETACWSSVWKTDEKVKEYYEIHNRAEDYCELNPGEIAYYDGLVYVDLSKIKPMIALPFHPSNVYAIEDLKANAYEILAKTEKEGLEMLGNRELQMNLTAKIKDGSIYVDQAIIAGCAGGTFDSISAAADILAGKSIGNGIFKMSIYPGSQPAYLELVKNNSIAKLMEAGVLIRSAFCGPCFGAGDTPANGELSIRHTTRNFPNREGSKPGEGQISSVALMDARSIAATAANEGRLTAATEIEVNYSTPKYYFNKSVYDNRVYDGWKKAEPEAELKSGPNIKDWPDMNPLSDNLLVKVISYITDPVTTTDELIPSGEASSYRSNPEKMAEFTLSRKDPGYLPAAKEIRRMEKTRTENNTAPEIIEVLDKFSKIEGLSTVNAENTCLGSSIYAHKPGDGSAREQAASCQKVLGGWANFALEYATKRYRTNLINWGILPFIVENAEDVELNSYILIPHIRKALTDNESSIKCHLLNENGSLRNLSVTLGYLTVEEREILLDGCLINNYKK